MTSQAWKISFLNFKTFQDTGEPGQTEPGLVAFYNIWPGNGVDLFFQPRSLYGAYALMSVLVITTSVTGIYHGSLRENLW